MEFLSSFVWPSKFLLWFPPEKNEVLIYAIWGPSGEQISHDIAIIDILKIVLLFLILIYYASVQVYQWPLESRTNNNKWCMMWVDILAMRSENFYTTTSVFALLCSWQTRPIIFPTIHFQLPAIYLYMIQLIKLSRFNFFSLNFQHHQRKHPY